MSDILDEHECKQIMKKAQEETQLLKDIAAGKFGENLQVLANAILYPNNLVVLMARGCVIDIKNYDVTKQEVKDE